MDKWVILSGLALVVLLTCFATLQAVLGMPSRARIVERMNKYGMHEQLERFRRHRTQLALAAATLRTVCVLSLALLVYEICRRTMTGGMGATYAVALFASLFIVLLFGVAIPNAWAKYGADGLAVKLLPVLLVLRAVLAPVLAFLELFDGLVRRVAGVPEDHDRTEADAVGQDILDAVTEGEFRGAVAEHEREMFESIIDLRDTDVVEIMTPRTDIVGVEKSASLAEVKAVLMREGHSRIPVYDETIDRVLGVVHVKDLVQLDEDAQFDVTQVMRKAHFIPETKKLPELLREFQQQKVHIAIVLDEYGGTAGLITIEDILEELVGEITDEYDVEEPEPIRRIDDNTVEVDARARIDELNDELHISLPEDEDYETIGGYVFSTLGKVPEPGECFSHDNVRIDVIDAEPRKINRLRLHIDRTERERSAETR